MNWSFRHSPFLVTLGLVLVAMFLLTIGDLLLARVERSEDVLAAAALYTQAQDAVKHGEAAQAVNHLKDAIAIERANRTYRIALAEAELASGDPESSRTILTDLLQSDPSDGRASLILARVLLRQGSFTDAVSYYHRAVFGRWPPYGPNARLQARFELIDVLAKHDSKDELLAELLAVQDQAPRDPAMRLRIGNLLISAGSPTRAIDEFRAVLADSPGSAAAQSGLGEAYFALGNYRQARRNFEAALRLTPGDAVAKQKLELCSELLQLDPMLRGLASSERVRRSALLLARSVEEFGRCNARAPGDQTAALIDQANAAAKARVPAYRESEALESNLALAEQLWRERPGLCGKAPARDTALSLVLERMSL
jgi:predicted Zn-dependent protease